MIHKIIPVLITGLALAGTVMAQINESDTAKLQLRASVAGNYQQGNVELLTLRSRVDFSVAPVKNLVFKSQNSSLYQSFYGKQADNDIFSRNYLYYAPQHSVYPFGIVYLSTNYRRKIDARCFAGAGITWQAVHTPSVVVKFSGSAVYERTNFNATTYNYPVYNGSDNIAVWRGTLYTGGWVYLLDKHLRLYYDAYWQPAFSNSDNFRRQFDLGIDFPVWKGLFITALYTYTHENVVAENIQQLDRILTFGLGYSLRKLQ